jgi:hypothetical protein
VSPLNLLHAVSCQPRDQRKKTQPPTSPSGRTPKSPRATFLADKPGMCSSATPAKTKLTWRDHYATRLYGWVSLFGLTKLKCGSGIACVERLTRAFGRAALASLFCLRPFFTKGWTNHEMHRSYRFDISQFRISSAITAVLRSRCSTLVAARRAAKVHPRRSGSPEAPRCWLVTSCSYTEFKDVRLNGDGGGALGEADRPPGSPVHRDRMNLTSRSRRQSSE